MSSNSIISNRKFIDIDTLESVDKYIDEICSDPNFLCKNDEHKSMCGANTSIYSNRENVETICENIKQANICENDIKECIVSAENTFENSQMYVSTSFLNIIIPIPDAYDNDGNIKFIRLPALAASRKKDSNEICSVCACMDRFARSPGSGFNDYTSPGQNRCVYGEKFEYYYYPLYVEQIRNKLTNAPKVTLGGKYDVINKNIIHINTEDKLTSPNLYNTLVKNGISEGIAKKFIVNVLYKTDKQSIKDLELYLLNKKTNKSTKSSFSGFDNTNNDSFFIYLIFISLVIFLLINLLKFKI